MPVSQVHKRKLSRNIAILAAIFLFCALVFMITLVKMANAAEIKECGTPAPAELDTEVTRDYCDIYSRQLAYVEESKKYHEMLQERRRNFAAPMNEARRNYEANRNALHNGQKAYNP